MLLILKRKELLCYAVCLTAAGLLCIPILHIPHGIAGYVKTKHAGNAEHLHGRSFSARLSGPCRSKDRQDMEGMKQLFSRPRHLLLRP